MVLLLFLFFNHIKGGVPFQVFREHFGPERSLLGSTLSSSGEYTHLLKTALNARAAIPTTREDKACRSTCAVFQKEKEKYGEMEEYDDHVEEKKEMRAEATERFGE